MCFKKISKQSIKMYLGVLVPSEPLEQGCKVKKYTEFYSKKICAFLKNHHIIHHTNKNTTVMREMGLWTQHLNMFSVRNKRQEHNKNW